MKLTKGMYGDPSCREFGISNLQIRGNSVINNAGWFNISGDRIGSGDLSLQDLKNIAKSLPKGEVFIALTEMDASLGLPSHLDRMAPGKDYILNNAVWIIAYDDLSKGNIIIKVKSTAKVPVVLTDDGVKYFAMTRKEFLNSLNYSPPAEKKTVPKSSTLEEKLKTLAKQVPAVPTSGMKVLPLNPNTLAPPPAKKVSSKKITTSLFGRKKP